ncbi:MAG: IgGFc-binding protein, partial [Bacteroidota bacterium]|nr:IgGFc-binding protein [Bacteroidota bacterium]
MHVEEFGDLSYLRWHMGGWPRNIMCFSFIKVVLTIMVATFGHFSFSQVPFVPGTTFSSPLISTEFPTIDSLNTYYIYLFAPQETCGRVFFAGDSVGIPFELERDSSIVFSFDHPPSLYDFPMENSLVNGIEVHSQRPICAIFSLNIGDGLINSLRQKGYKYNHNEASALIPQSSLSKNYFVVPLMGELGNQVLSGANYFIVNNISPNNIKSSLSTRSFLSNNDAYNFIPSHERRDVFTLPISGKATFPMYVFNIDSSLSPIASNPSFDHSIGSYFQGVEKFGFFSISLTLQDSSFTGTNGLAALEQQVPPDYSGLNYFFPEMSGYEGLTYSLLSLNDSTSIQINNGGILSLDSLENFSDAINTSLEIKATKPILVSLGNRTSIPNGPYDKTPNPFSLNLFSTQSRMRKAFFRALPLPDNTSIYSLVLVCKTSVVSNFVLDGTSINSSNFTPFPIDNTWAYANLSVSEGNHIVENDSGFIGYHYCYNVSGPESRYPNYGINLISLDEQILDPTLGLFEVSKGSNSPTLFAHFSDSLCPDERIMIHLPDVYHTDWNIDWGDGSSVQVSVEDSIPGPVSHAYSMTGPYTIYVNDISGC